MPKQQVPFRYRFWDGMKLFWSILFVALLTVLVVRHFDRIYLTLPNGLILIGAPAQGIDAVALYTADGEIRLVTKVEFVCFNDDYVWVYAYSRGESGLYAAHGGAGLEHLDYGEAKAFSGLGGNGRACNGYYTGMLGPNLLFEGNRAPFRPPSAWRNFDNPSLRDRRWFDRPCDDDDWFARQPEIMESAH